MARTLTPADLANYAARATEAKDFGESMREHLLARDSACNWAFQGIRAVLYGKANNGAA